MLVLSKDGKPVPIKDPKVVGSVRDALTKGLKLGPGKYPAIIVID